MVNDRLTFDRRHSYPKFLMKWLLLCAPFFAFSAAAQRVSVVMQHGDLQRTGWNSKETTLNVNNVRPSTFGKAYSVAVDDQIYAQPLVLSRVTIGGGVHNVVYVATANNTVYAIDADKALVYWTQNYTAAGQRPPKNIDMTGACGGGYQDLNGNIGIIGTPVIDSVSQTIYFVTRSTTGAFYSQHLHAVDISTGAERAGSPQRINASQAGTGDGSNNGSISFDAQRNNQRPGLLLLNGIVYIGYSSHCDWAPYHGWLLGYDAKTLAQKIVYSTTPDGYAGGIWMSGAAPAVDELGNIYVAVGNGSIGANGDRSNVRNRSESAVKLVPNGSTLAVSTFFTPNNYEQLEEADLDFGTSQMLLLPNTKLAVTGCKDGNIYLMNRDNMGGYNTGANQVVQTIPLGSGKGLRSSFAYYQGGGKEFFYTWSENAALKAFPFNRSTGTFDVASVVIGSAQGPTGSSGTLMAVSSKGTTAGTGILWASHAASGDANHTTRPGILRAFDASDVTKELWNSNQNTRDNIGGFAKFVCPTVANGKVYMATFSKQLIVYGVISAESPSCAATTNVALNKPAFASAVEDAALTPASAAFDNSATTRWASAKGVDPQWIYVDLQGRYDLCRAVLTWETALGKNFELQVSDDAQTWTPVTPVTGNTALVNNLPLQATGRYVRMYGTARGTSFGYSLYDFQVFGTPASGCATPAGLAASNLSRSGALLTWSAVPGVGSYNVAYKAVADLDYTLATANTNSFVLDNKLGCGTDYLFKIQAVCSATGTGAFSGDRAFSTLTCDPNCGPLPTRWSSQDVGLVGVPGQSCYNNSAFHLKASGDDIWDTADGFRYAFKTFSGDGQITARVDSLKGYEGWNKAGVMFRETLESNSRHALMALTGSNGAAFQYRQETNGYTANTSLLGIQPPYYVKLIKRGTQYTGYVSQDSLTWKRVGAPVDLGFGSGAIEAGIVLTSHANDQLATAVFSHVPLVFSADTTLSSPAGNCPPDNLTLNRPAASSSTLNQDHAFYEFQAFDGDAATRWASAAGSGPQWLYVDLGQRYAVCQVRVKWDAALAQNFEVQTSDDAQTWTSLAKIVGNQGRLSTVPVRGSGRFIRVYATVPATSGGYSINELEVSGTPEPNQPVNLALGKTATASSIEIDPYGPQQAVDHLGTTRWASAQGLESEWMQVDLGKSYKLSQVVLDWETALGQDFLIQLSTNGTTWTTAKTVTGNTSYSNVLPVVGTARYVRMQGVKRGFPAGYSLYEFEVYGTEVPATTSVYEAEDAVLSGVQVANQWPGYSGTGFGDYINPTNDFVEWTVNVPAAGTYQLGFRYALGDNDRPLQIKVNGAVASSSLSFPGTGAWGNWQTVGLSASLNAGSNKVRATAINRSGANVDRLEVSAGAQPAVKAVALKTSSLAMGQEMTLYPNPATRAVTVTLPQNEAEELAVYDVSGRLVRHLDKVSGQSQVVIPLGNLPAGIYTVRIRDSNQVYVKRLVKLQE